MNNDIADRTHQLIAMIYQLVDIIRYENTFAYTLLMRITCERRTMIELDGCRVYLEAVCTDDNDYYLTAFPGRDEVPIQFITTSYVLRKIMAGIVTLDTAVVKNEIHVRGTFEDVINMHRLTTCFLSEGPLNFRLRNLWAYFNETWNNDRFPLAIKPLEEQKPRHGYLLDNIPENVLLIRV